MREQQSRAIECQMSQSKLRIPSWSAESQQLDRALVACDYLLAPTDLFAMRSLLTLSYGVLFYGNFNRF
jgi:hypothetical protein